MAFKEYVYWIALTGLLLAPITQAVPEFREESASTYQVTIGDSITLPTAPIAATGGTVTLTAPNGDSMQFTRNTEQAGGGQEYNLAGTRVSTIGSAQYTATGSLIGVPGDGTWTIEVTGLLSGRYTLTVDPDTSIRFEVGAAVPSTATQFWNQHETTSGTTWIEPSTEGGVSATTIDPPDEARDEDPNFARFFGQVGSPPPPEGAPSAATGGFTINCGPPDDMDVTGAWARGPTQTGNTFVQFHYVQGNTFADTDLRDNVGTMSTTVTDDGSGVNGTHTETILYNNAVGMAYQFSARNGTGGDETLGQVVNVPPDQCVQPPAPELDDFELNPDQFRLHVSQAQCREDETSFVTQSDQEPGGSDSWNITVFDSLTGDVVLVIDDSEMNDIDGGRVSMVGRVLPPGPFVALGLFLDTGLAQPDYFMALAFAVPEGTCIDSPTDLTPVLTNQGTMIDLLNDINGTVTNINNTLTITIDDLVMSIDNLTVAVEGTDFGNFTELLQILTTNITDHRNASLELMAEDFGGLDFGEYLIFLFWIAVLYWSARNGHTALAVVAMLGALLVFFSSPPIAFVGMVFLGMVVWLVTYLTSNKPDWLRSFGFAGKR